MAQNLFNQTYWNCSAGFPQRTTRATPHISELLTTDVVIFLSIMCALASVIGTLGNSLVLLAVRNNQNLRTIPDLFIASLAFSDLSVCALYLPMVIYNINHRAPDDHYMIFYAAKRFLGHASMVASASNMFAVTVDRVIAIRFSFKYIAVVTTRNALVGILVVWFVALTFGSLYIRQFVSTRFVSSYNVILLLLTIIMYIYIFVIAKRQENRIHNVHQGPEGIVAEKKVAKTVFTVVGFYVLCWVPLLLLPAFVNPATNPIRFSKSFRWVKTLLACNSAINPYIYCMRSQKYRTAFGKILQLKRTLQ